VSYGIQVLCTSSGGCNGVTGATSGSIDHVSLYHVELYGGAVSFKLYGNTYYHSGGSLMTFKEGDNQASPSFSNHDAYSLSGYTEPASFKHTAGSQFVNTASGDPPAVAMAAGMWVRTRSATRRCRLRRPASLRRHIESLCDDGSAYDGAAMGCTRTKLEQPNARG